MTDLLGDDAELDDAIDKDSSVESSLTCTEPGCDFATTPSHANGARQQLGFHRYNAHGITKKKPERRPRSVGKPTVNINTAPRPNRAQADRAKIEERARNLLSTIAGLLQAMGEAEDAADIRRGREALAAATAQLAEYEPWLKTALSGGKLSDRALAWFAFIMALLAVLIPIADRHGVIPDQLKAQLKSIGIAAPGAPVGDSSGDPHSEDQPAAA